MKPMYMFAATALVILGIGYSVAVENEKGAPMRQALDLGGCEDCGVEKLTDDELGRLVTIIASRRGFSFLDESARQYLRKQGWVPAEIIGYRPDTSIADSSDDVLMMVVRDGKLYAMESPMGEEAWPTGLFWTKAVFSSSWEVIDPEGKSVSCDISELR